MAGRSGAKFLRSYQELLLIRHWLHKEYVNSENILNYTKGFNFVVLNVIRWTLRAALIFVFFFGVESLLERNWVWVGCSWLVFNALFEAYQWAKDSSNEVHIRKIDEGLKSEFFAKYTNSGTEKIEDENSQSRAD